MCQNVCLTGRFFGCHDRRVSGIDCAELSFRAPQMSRKATASMSLETRCEPFLYRSILGVSPVETIMTS